MSARSKKIKGQDDDSAVYTVYVHIANRSLIVGHYKARNKESAQEAARRDLGDMLKLGAFPQAAYENRPYFVEFLELVEKYLQSTKRGQNDD